LRPVIALVVQAIINKDVLATNRNIFFII